MITSLVRRDIALKSVFYTWLLLSLFVGIILSGAGRISPSDPNSTSMVNASAGPVSVYALLISWLLLSLYLGPAEVADHANRMTISLPVPAKKVWLSRVLALTIAETSMFIVTGLVIVLVNLITGSSAIFPTYLAKFLIQQLCCILLLVMVIQSLYIKRMAMPSILSSYAILILVWAAAGALLYILAQYPIQYALLPLAGAALIFLITFSRLPASFSTEPQTYPKARPFGERLPLQSPGFLLRAKTRWIVWITLFRTLFNPWFSPLFILALGILAMANMDYGLRGKDHITMVIGIWMFLLILQFIAIQQLYQLDHLPISRRVIYACQVLPSIGVLISMSIVGIAAANFTVGLNSDLAPWTSVLPLNLVLILFPWFIMQSFIFAAPRASGVFTRLSILTAVCSLGYIATLLVIFSANLSLNIPNLLTISISDLSLKIPVESQYLWISAIVILVSGYFVAERFFTTAQIESVKKYRRLIGQYR